MRILLVLVLLFSSLVQATEVYMSRDENGHLTFSDKPSANAERHEVQALPSVPALAPASQRPTLKTAPASAMEYTSLSIINPTNEQTIPTGHAGNVEVSAILSPALAATDTIFLLDNAQVLQQGRLSSFALANLSRGEHKIQLQVKDKKGKILITSNTVTIYVQRASVLRRQPPQTKK